MKTDGANRRSFAVVLAMAVCASAGRGLCQDLPDADDLLAPAREAMQEQERKKAEMERQRKKAAGEAARAGAKAAQAAREQARAMEESLKHGDTAEHPRLVANPALLEAIRAEVKKKGSHHQQAYEAMKARVELSIESMARAYRGGGEDETAPPAPLNPQDYAWGYRAREAAFLALLAMTPEEQKKYSELAYKAAMETATGNPGSLNGGMGAMSLALVYDWGHPGWTPEQRETVRKKALGHLNGFPGRDRVSKDFGFNKGGVFGGSEILLMIALGEEKLRQTRYDHVKEYLIKHIESAYDPWGVSQEGPGYSEYPGSFLLPAALAARQAGDEDIVKAVATRSWWKLVMYAWTFMDAERQSAMWGVGSGQGPGEGWVSAILGSVPADQMPYYLWFYNRAEGIRSPKPAIRRFDSGRGMTPFSLLCYPVGVAEKDPTGIFPQVYYDEARGFAFIRNRWKDWDDIQVTISADAIKPITGWDAPDALAVNLLAFNTRFFGAHAKRGSIAAYTTLLVDGRYGQGNSIGRTNLCETLEDGACVIVDGGMTYENLGCRTARRHLAVRFEKDKSRALISTLDRIESETQHIYTWQGNLGDERGDGGVMISGGQEGGRPTFLLKGRNNGFVKGWVLHPADAAVEAAGDPLKINVKGGDADIWVVMFAGQEEPPAATVTGEGMASILRVSDRTVSFDAAAQRLRIE